MATEYKPGAKCEHSGIYGVEHDEKHAEPHEVTVVFGESFSRHATIAGNIPDLPCSGRRFI